MCLIVTNVNLCLIVTNVNLCLIVTNVNLCLIVTNVNHVSNCNECKPVSNCNECKPVSNCNECKPVSNCNECKPVSIPDTKLGRLRAARHCQARADHRDLQVDTLIKTSPRCLSVILRIMVRFSHCQEDKTLSDVVIEHVARLTRTVSRPSCSARHGLLWSTAARHFRTKNVYLTLMAQWLSDQLLGSHLGAGSITDLIFKCPVGRHFRITAKMF